MACRRLNRTQSADDRPYHSVERLRAHRLSDRTVRDDVHASERCGQCRPDLLLAGDTLNADPRSVRLRMGVPYSRAAGPVRLDDEKGWYSSQTFPVTAVGLRPDHRRYLHVYLAHR